MSQATSGQLRVVGGRLQQENVHPNFSRTGGGSGRDLIRTQEHFGGSRGEFSKGSGVSFDEVALGEVEPLLYNEGSKRPRLEYLGCKGICNDNEANQLNISTGSAQRASRDK